MEREIVRVEGVSPPNLPFNYIVKAGGLLFLTSQLSVDLKTNEILRGDIREQTRNAMENVKFLLESTGASMDKAVRIRIYLRDVAAFDLVNDVYRDYFEPGQEPARVVVQAASPIEGVDIEIEVVAVAPC